MPQLSEDQSLLTVNRHGDFFFFAVDFPNIEGKVILCPSFWRRKQKRFCFHSFFWFGIVLHIFWWSG